MASYSEQVVICTGKEDWTSRIEDEQSDSGDLVRGLKKVIGRGGEGFDVGKMLFLLKFYYYVRYQC
jgi:hypothetical protein